VLSNNRARCVDLGATRSSFAMRGAQLDL